jgi:hypothetical protein
MNSREDGDERGGRDAFATSSMVETDRRRGGREKGEPPPRFE